MKQLGKIIAVLLILVAFYSLHIGSLTSILITIGLICWGISILLEDSASETARKISERLKPMILILMAAAVIARYLFDIG